MINGINESKISKDKKEEAHINRLLAINFLLKVIQAVIFSMKIYKQEIIEVGNGNGKNKNKSRWNYCHHMPILSLLGANHRLTLLHMAKRFIWIGEKGELINGFRIGYMINPSLHVNKASVEQKLSGSSGPGGTDGFCSTIACST